MRMKVHETPAERAKKASGLNLVGLLDNSQTDFIYTNINQ